MANGNLYVGSYDGHLYAIGSNPVESTFPYYLALRSRFGIVHGAGGYRVGSVVVFSVSPTTVPGGPGVRHVFTHWTSDRIGGYTGPNATGLILMDKAISETAHWKTQYYLKLKVTPEGGGSIFTTSGWYDTGSSIEITATPNPGYRFIGFEGTGEGSYTGSERGFTIQLTGLMDETAVFKRFPPIQGYWFIAILLGLPLVGYLVHRVLRRRWSEGSTAKTLRNGAE